MNSPLHLLNRRAFFQNAGLGIGALALGSLLREASAAPANPLSARAPHFAPKAKRVIYLHMVGAPSQLDLFDHKPELLKLDGQPCPEEFIKGKRFAFLRGHPNIAASHYAFEKRGRSGATISELLPN